MVNILGKGQVKNNIMVDDKAEIFSFCYGDKNDGRYESVGYGKNYYIRHHIPAKCFGIVEVEPLEEGGYVWRNFEDFEVDVEYHEDYDCSDYCSDYSYDTTPTPIVCVSMNYAQRCVIKHQIEKHEKKMADIDAIWEKRGVTDVTAEPEWDYYEGLFMARVELGLGIE